MGLGESRIACGVIYRKKDRQRWMKQYGTFTLLCQCVLNFLNAYLKHERSALKFLRQTPASNGITEVLSDVKMKVKM